MSLEFKYGSDRKVIIDKQNNIVIKVATNQRGLVQNFNDFFLQLF